MGRPAASRCRKPSSSFSCWGRQRRKVKSPDCRGKGLGGILHQRLVLITASTLLHCGDIFGSSCRIGAGRGFQLSRQASVLRRISQSFQETSNRAEMSCGPDLPHVCPPAHTHMHAQITYTPIVPAASSRLCAALCNFLRHPSANFSRAES